jgi:hypothetical protein
MYIYFLKEINLYKYKECPFDFPMSQPALLLHSFGASL